MSESSPDINSAPESPEDSAGEKTKSPDSIIDNEASTSTQQAFAAAFPRVPLSAAAAAQMVAANAAAAAAMAANRLQQQAAVAAANTTAKKTVDPSPSSPNGNLLQLQLVNENGSITPIEVVTSMAAAIAQHQKQMSNGTSTINEVIPKYLTRFQG